MSLVASLRSLLARFTARPTPAPPPRKRRARRGAAVLVWVAAGRF